MSPSQSESPLLLPNIPFHGLSSFGSEGYGLNKLDPNELALLQHQPQMQHLQLLQQLQGNPARMEWHGLDPQGYGNLDVHAYSHAHNLMPSADIMSNDVYPFDSILPAAPSSAQAIGHGRKVPGAKSSARSPSFNKSPIGVASEHFGGRHAEEDFVAHRHSLAGGPDLASVRTF